MEASARCSGNDGERTKCETGCTGAERKQVACLQTIQTCCANDQQSNSKSSREGLKDVTVGACEGLFCFARAQIWIAPLFPPNSLTASFLSNHPCCSPFLQCAALVGEDQPLCPDLPELDLSELDVSDLDADSFLGGLKWYSDQSEIISTQYGNEASNLFEVRRVYSIYTVHIFYSSVFHRCTL